MHMKMGVGMFAKQLLKLLVQLLKTFVVLRDGERRSGRLTIAAEKGHAICPYRAVSIPTPMWVTVCEAFVEVVMRSS